MPELADWLDPLEPEELALLKQQIARDGLIDPVCWAPISRPDGTTAETILDGHHRYAVCMELDRGKSLPASKWQLIEGVTTIAEARAWMYEKQAGRRNWSANRQAIAVAQLYEEAKVESGRRTDIYGGGKVDTAEVIGEQFKLTGRAVRDCVKFATAVDKLTDAIGIDARVELLSHRPPVNRETVIELAEAPEDLRREAWTQILRRNTAGARNVLAKAKRAEYQKRPGLQASKAETATAALDRYDLADLVRLIAEKWPPERLETYNPSPSQMMWIGAHMTQALRNLIWLAERYGWGEEALDEYRLEAAQEIVSGAPAPDAADEPFAHPGAPDADLEDTTAAKAEPTDDDLRRRLSDRLADHMGSTGMAGVARKIGIGARTLKAFLAGNPIYTKTRGRIEAYLSAT